METRSVGRAILEALAYSDIFDYPLTLDEIHRYLTLKATVPEITMQIGILSGNLLEKDGFYSLVGKEKNFEFRSMRERNSEVLFRVAVFLGQWLGTLPFVRMVGMTGSLAMKNLSKNRDMDFMIVTTKDRVWMTRGFIVAINRITRIFGMNICPNLIISENALDWPLHDLYSARELFQMIPLYGYDVYHSFIDKNSWASRILPNAKPFPISKNKKFYPWNFLQTLVELILNGRIGDSLEAWEMNRKIKKFSELEGFGEETIFTKDVCQGNFHHHRLWTKAIYEEKIHKLDPYGEIVKEDISL